MEDIIVLILTLIFIAASIFGQVKKRQQQTKEHDEPASANDSFWKTLGLDVDKEEEHEAEIEHFQPEKEGGRVDRFHTDAGGMRREFSNRKKPSPPLAVTTFSKKKSQFPLKKAIIYSEILNRKYF